MWIWFWCKAKSFTRSLKLAIKWNGDVYAALYCVLCSLDYNIQKHKLALVIFFPLSCIQLYSGTIVQLYKCTVVRLYSCIIVELHNCTVAQLYNCTIVQLHNCTIAQLFYLKLYNCTGIGLLWIKKILNASYNVF